MPQAAIQVCLSVDDDENSHVLLRHAFAKAGVTARLLHLDDGAEAIRYLSGEGEYADRARYPLPSVLLLDLKMPRVSGLGVLEYIAANPTFKSIPVVVFTTSNNSDDIFRAYEFGCHSYVVKPSGIERLIDFVRALDVEFLGGDRTAGAPSLASFRSPPPMERPAGAPASKSPAVPPPQNVRGLPISAPEVFTLLVEQMKDYAIFMLDRQGTIATWNEGARRITGYESSQAIGRPFALFYSTSEIDSEKPDFDLRMAREMGRYEDEGWRVRKDGSRFWANIIIAPLRDDSTGLGLIGFAVITRDLTQRKLQEESQVRLLESEERFRLLVEQVKDYAIFHLDPRGNIASWNQGARRLKGYTADEILGKHFSIFYLPEDVARNHPAEELNIAIREGHYEEEGWRLRKDGTRFWASVVITSLWDKRGNLTGFAKVTRDLSRKRREEEALRHKTEELEAFAQTLSHDLRSPLRSINGFAQILSEDFDQLSAEDRQTFLGNIIESAGAMDRLISGILEYSQMSLIPGQEAPVNIEDVFHEVLRLHESEIQTSHAQILFQGTAPMVQGNRTLLVQVFSNLLGNALKFVPEGQPPRIRIHYAYSNSDCEIHVQDFGIGIPENYQESIFRMFDRGPVGARFRGTGVGLAIVKRAVERLGGHISLHSQSGQGSDFVVTLPCVTAAAVSAGSVVEN